MTVELGMSGFIIRREALRCLGLEEHYLERARQSQAQCYDEHLLVIATMGGNGSGYEALLADGLIPDEDLAGDRCPWLEFQTLGQGAFPIFHCRTARLKGTSLLPVIELPMLVPKRDKCGMPRPWLA